jgi:hypothetical protein
MDLFRAKPPVDITRREQMKELIREHFGLNEDCTVTLVELRCTEEGCPPLETVIGILSAEGQRQYKIHKSLNELEEADIRCL